MDINIRSRSNLDILTEEKNKALIEAYNLLLETLSEYAEKNDLPKEQISQLKEQIHAIYSDKKATYYLEKKLSDFSDYLQKALLVTMTESGELDDPKEISKLFYYNNRKLIEYG